MLQDETLRGGGPRARLGSAQSGILYEKLFNLKLSGNEVYYTAWSLLVMLKNSCSKLRCQKVLNWKAFRTRSRLSGVFPQEPPNVRSTFAKHPSKQFQKSALSLWGDLGRRWWSHTVEFAGFVPPEFWGIRDQICTTWGPKVNCVRRVDFRWTGRTPPSG